MTSYAGPTDASFGSETLAKKKSVSLLCSKIQALSWPCSFSWIVSQRIEVSRLLFKELQFMEYYVLIIKLLIDYGIIS